MNDREAVSPFYMIGKSLVDVARDFREKCLRNMETHKIEEFFIGMILGMKVYVKLEFSWPKPKELQGGANDHSSNVGETGQREDDAQKKPT